MPAEGEGDLETLFIQRQRAVLFAVKSILCAQTQNRVHRNTGLLLFMLPGWKNYQISSADVQFKMLGNMGQTPFERVYKK